MKKFFHYVFVRQRHNWRQLFRFGAVGGSGAVVNMIVIVLCKKAFPDYMAIAAPLPIGDFNIRWYHVFLMIGFIVSNLWNFQINRLWTFKSGKHAGWWREYAPFLTVGLVAVAVGQGLLTLMLNHSSPLRLTNFFPVLDDSTGLRTPLYWAMMIQIVLTMPINYVINKLWTFRAVFRRHQKEANLPMVAPAVAPEAVDEAGRPIAHGEGDTPVDTDSAPTDTDSAGDTHRA